MRSEILTFSAAKLLLSVLSSSSSRIPRYRLKSDTKYRKIQKTGRRVRPREDWIEFDVPAIITKARFDKARKRIGKNVIFNPKNRKHNYLLTGLVKCPCGNNRNGDGPAGKKYYRCISRHRYYDKINRCTVGGLNVEVLDGLVWQQIAQLLSDPALLRQHTERWLNTQNKPKTSNLTKDFTKLRKGLENEQRRYVEAYGKGLMPEALFAEKMKSTNKEKDSLAKEQAQASKNRGIVAKIDIEQLIAKATRKIGDLNFENKKHIVERIVDKIIASPQEVTIWGHIPVPALATASGKVKHVSQHRHRRPPKCW